MWRVRSLLFSTPLQGEQSIEMVCVGLDWWPMEECWRSSTWALPSFSSSSPSLQHVLWSAAGGANRKHTVLQRACVWPRADDQNPFVIQPISVQPYLRTIADFSFLLLLLINLSLTWKCSFVLRATNQLLPAWNNYKMYFLYFFLPGQWEHAVICAPFSTSTCPDMNLIKVLS